MLVASPFAIGFGPTAFTDPWLALWLVAATWAALGGRPALAGFLLGLAVASKQTGVLGLLLVMAAAAQSRRRPATAARSGPASGLEVKQAHAAVNGRGHLCTARRGFINVRAVLIFSLALLLTLAPLSWWDSLRWATRPSFWSRSLETYGGLGLAAPVLWPERLRAWSEQMGYLFGRPALTLPFVALAGLAAWQAYRDLIGQSPAGGPAAMVGQAHRPPDEWETTLGQRQAGAAFELLAAAFVVAYLAVHFFITFQPWDRYLLPVFPLLCLLAARGCIQVWRYAVESPAWYAGRLRAGLGLAMGVALLAACGLGLAGRVPVGSEQSAYAGLDQVVTTLRTLPWSAVVYQRSIGWQVDFYMFGNPPPRIWWDQAGTLAEDAEYGINVMPNREQWLVLATAVDGPPGGPVELAARRALAQRGMNMLDRRHIYRPDGSISFLIYQIVPASETSCAAECAAWPVPDG